MHRVNNRSCWAALGEDILGKLAIASSLPITVCPFLLFVSPLPPHSHPFRAELPARSRITQIIDHVCTCLPSLKPPPPLTSPFAPPTARHTQPHPSSSRHDLLSPSDARYECTVQPTTGAGAVDLHGLGLGVSECVPYTVAKFLLADEHQQPALPAELQDTQGALQGVGGLGFGRRQGSGGLFIGGASEGGSGRGEGGIGGRGDAYCEGVSGGSGTDGSVTSGMSEGGVSEGGMSEGVSDVAFSPVFSAGLGPTHKPLSTAKISVDNLMSPVHSMLQVGP